MGVVRRTSRQRSWIVPFLVLGARLLARRSGGVLLARGRCLFEVVASLSASGPSCSRFGQPCRLVLVESSSRAYRVLFERRPELESLVLRIQVVIEGLQLAYSMKAGPLIRCCCCDAVEVRRSPSPFQMGEASRGLESPVPKMEPLQASTLASKAR